jgi:hypothetical protein
MSKLSSVTLNGSTQRVIDTTYHTQQRDMFASGLAAEIGVYAYAVWNAIKAHSDFNTGDSYPGIRKLCKLTGISDQKVQSSIKDLEAAHLLRVVKKVRKTNHYVARERMDVRVGSKVICTVVVDYIPAQMRVRLAQLKSALAGDLSKEEVWAQVELIPGPGMKLDSSSGTLKSDVRADQIFQQLNHGESAVMLGSREEAREKLKQIADQMRVKVRTPLPEK